MAEQNILAGDIRVLGRIIRDVREHNTKKDRLDKLNASIKDLNKESSALEKSLQDTVTAKVKESVDAICEGYDKSIASDKEKLKDVQVQRDKAKLAGIKERIDSETLSIRQNVEDLKKQINEAFIQQNVPKYCNSRLYLALFYSKSFLDVLVYLLFMLVVYLAIPILLLTLTPLSQVWFIVYYFCSVLIVFSIYRRIYEHTMVVHSETIIAAADAKKQIAMNKKKIQRIQKSIKKDQNEEMYGLGEFDIRINELHDDISRIEAQKNAAVADFEKTAKNDIVDAIDARYRDKIDAIKADVQNKTVEQAELEELVRNQRIYISSNYEAYLGKDLMNIDKLMEINTIMKSGSANSIESAIAILNTKH